MNTTRVRWRLVSGAAGKQGCRASIWGVEDLGLDLRNAQTKNAKSWTCQLTTFFSIFLQRKNARQAMLAGRFLHKHCTAQLHWFVYILHYKLLAGRWKRTAFYRFSVQDF